MYYMTVFYVPKEDEADSKHSARESTFTMYTVIAHSTCTKKSRKFALEGVVSVFKIHLKVNVSSKNSHDESSQASVPCMGLLRHQIISLSDK